jgi:excisionase family DNA binding protein
MAKPTPKQLTTKEAADELGISLRQVQTLIQRGKLPATKFGRDYTISTNDLELVRERPKGRPRKDDDGGRKR